MLFRLVLALFLIASQALALFPEKTRQLLTDAKEPVRIVCIGDSITGVYYHSGGMRAYPEMLQIALQKLHPKAKVTVRNAGISGDTSKGGLARLERDVLAQKPHLVTIMFGMNDLVRPTLYDAYHDIWPIEERVTRDRRLLTQDIVGPVCETGDYLAVERPLPPFRPGDLMAVMTAGAYGAVMASTYNTRPLIPEVLVHGDRYAVIRPRPTYDELIGLDRIPAWLPKT